MAQVTCDKPLTALLVIDPYKDFMYEGGEVCNCLKAVAEANGCGPHMLQVLRAVRKAGLVKGASAMVTTEEVVVSLALVAASNP